MYWTSFIQFHINYYIYSEQHWIIKYILKQKYPVLKRSEQKSSTSFISIQQWVCEHQGNVNQQWHPLSRESITLFHIISTAAFSLDLIEFYISSWSRYHYKNSSCCLMVLISTPIHFVVLHITCVEFSDVKNADVCHHMSGVFAQKVFSLAAETFQVKRFSWHCKSSDRTSQMWKHLEGTRWNCLAEYITVKCPIYKVQY